MVITNIWTQVNKSKFWDFVGVSLLNISIGISISIAKSDSFIFNESTGTKA